MDTFLGEIFWAIADWSGACGDIQDALFNHQVFNDVIDTFAEDESVALSRTLPCRINPDLRSRAVRLVSLAVLSEEFANDEVTWFWVTQAFDTMSATLGNAAEESVLACAAAACLTGFKLADRAPPGKGFARQLADVALRVSAERGRGRLPPEAVVDAQRQLVAKLRSRLRAPTVAGWVHAILVRFDAATCGAHSGHLEEVQGEARKVAHQLLWCTPVSADCLPRLLAAGSCIVALCAAGLVPQQALLHLGKDRVASETIRVAVAAARVSLGARTVQEPDADFQRACELLQFAAACDAEETWLALELGVAAATAHHQQAN